jgi:hypothetical protein
MQRTIQMSPFCILNTTDYSMVDQFHHFLSLSLLLLLLLLLLMALQPFVGPRQLFQFLNAQLVGPLGRGSALRNASTYTQDNTYTTAHRHWCLEWDLNPQPQPCLRPSDHYDRAYPSISTKICFRILFCVITPFSLVYIYVVLYICIYIRPCLKLPVQWRSEFLLNVGIHLPDCTVP